MSVTTLTGANRFLIDQELQNRISSFTAANGDMGVERIDAEGLEADDVLARLGAQSLFAQKKITVIRNLSKNRELAEQFSSVLDQPPQDTEIVLLEPKIDGRGKLYKTLKTKTDFKEFSELKPPLLTDWVIKAVQERGGSINRQVAEHLVNKAGPNQQLLSSEIDKLLLYSKDITKETIDLLVVPNILSTTFDLANAVFSHQRERALKLYQDQCALKIEPVVIIGSLAWQLHLLALVKSTDKSADQIARDVGMSPWTISKTRQLAAGISSSEIKRAIALLLAIDTKSKSESLNIDDALKLYILKIS